MVCIIVDAYTPLHVLLIMRLYFLVKEPVNASLL